MNDQSIQPVQEDAEASSESGTDAPEPGLTIRWGRVAALVVALAVAFLLGWRLASRTSASPELARARRDLQQARAQIDELRAAAGEAASPTPSASPTPEPEATEGADVEVGDTYVVKPGDTLQSIAQKFYEDRTLDDVIARANDITDPSQLTIGRELVIPNRPEL
jgi:nucleoid-associated protein YgaU